MLSSTEHSTLKVQQLTLGANTNHGHREQMSCWWWLGCLVAIIAQN